MYWISVIIQIVKTETHSLILHLSATCTGQLLLKTHIKKKKRGNTMLFYIDLTSWIMRFEH